MQNPLQGRRILVVEDEYLVAMEIEDILVGLGAEVVGPFARLEPALAVAQRDVLDGAVLDVSLGGERIDPVVAVLVARGVPILLTTGYESEQLPPDFRQLPRLPKPFIEGELQRMIEQTSG